MCTLFANLYVLLTWGPHMVYMGTPYIFDIYMIRCGWLGAAPPKLNYPMRAKRGSIQFGYIKGGNHKRVLYPIPVCWMGTERMK